jgi:hypothetical protein
MQNKMTREETNDVQLSEGNNPWMAGTGPAMTTGEQRSLQV